MNDFILWLLGKSDVVVPEGGRMDVVWLHRPHSWMVFVSIAVIGAILYASWRMYSKENTACPKALKRILAVLRLFALAMLILILLGPALVISLEKIVEPWVFLVVDESSSMSIKDRYPEAEDAARAASALDMTPEKLLESQLSRAEIVNNLLLRNDQQFVKDLATKGRVRIFTFASKPILRETIGMSKGDDDVDPLLERGEPVPPLNPFGPVSASTNMSRGIREALRRASGGRASAVVLISDGRNTAGDDPAEYALELRESGIPVHAVGVGDPSQPKNVRVADLWMPESVFRGDPMKISVTIDSQGYADKSVEVELVQAPIDESDAAGKGTVIGRKTVALSGKPQTVAIEYNPEKAGKFLITARVPLQDAELLENDNKRSGNIRVSDEKMRVLLIAGGPSWDYRLTKNLLRRDKTIDLSCWLQTMDPDMVQEGDTPIKSLPDTAKKIMEYDVILFFDPDHTEFSTEWIDTLKTFVETHAGGLLWVAGPQNSMTFLTHPRTKGIQDVLPVNFANLEAGIIEAMGSSTEKSWPTRLRAESVDHPVFQGLNPKPGEWERMPGVYWSFPTKKAKPGAQCLMEHSNPRLRSDGKNRPLVVAGQYGAGRVMYVGINGTWRWRQAGVEIYDRFWIQTVRYLLEGKQAAGQRQGRLLTDADTYSSGDRVVVTATVYDDKYQPLKAKGFTAEIFKDKDKVDSIEMKPVPGREGVYEGNVTAKNLGVNEVRLSVDEGVARPLKLTRRFTVEMPNVEFANPRMNKALLKDVAERSGGTYYDIDQFYDIPKAITNQREVTIVRQRPIMLWDTARIIGLLVILLSIEWAVRRRFRLL